jgi:hypothetical protein
VLWLFAVLMLFAPDAHAWGLQTHVFFAHYAVLVLSFADPELRRAVARLPGLVLAGACLPDLALAGSALGTPVFRRTHRWSTLRRLATAPRDDAERALALGYASHLVSDVIAHNLFVPEHEARLVNVGHVTHAVAEWAMDRHVQEGFKIQPREVLALHHQEAVAFVSRVFRCEPAAAGRALRFLQHGDGLLRASPIPRLCRKVLSLVEKTLEKRFDSYLRRTLGSLRALEPALDGRFADWESSDPEGDAGNRRQIRNGSADRRARQHVARVMQAEDHP